MHPRQSEVFQKSGYFGKADFARIGYLEDGSGKCLFLTLSQGAASGALPQMGLTAASNTQVMRLGLRDGKTAIVSVDRGAGRANAIAIRWDKL
jgi:hypothetical protein